VKCSVFSNTSVRARSGV